MKAYARRSVLFPLFRQLFLDLQTVLKISVCTVDGSHRIVGQDAVLDHQSRDPGLRILVKQGVMAHAEAQGDIEIRLLLF